MIFHDFKCSNEECDIKDVIEVSFDNHDEYLSKKEGLKCTVCGSKLEVIFTSIGITTANFSNPTIDIKVGVDASKKWNKIDERKKLREKQINAGYLKKQNYINNFW